MNTLSSGKRLRFLLRNFSVYRSPSPFSTLLSLQPEFNTFFKHEKASRNYSPDAFLMFSYSILFVILYLFRPFCLSLQQNATI